MIVTDITVSACMIVKNEAALLEGCLVSLDGHVDEIVLVDTGSTDDTVAIAKDHGCRVLHQAWQNDFSRARNLALENAQSDWILYIDADERLSCPPERTLGSLIPGQFHVAARIRFRPRSDMTAYSEMRLFRCDPRIRFVGSMHETMVPAVDEVCAADGLHTADLFDISIDHLGYDGDQSHKHERNLPLLTAAIQQNPSRVYLRYHLGVTLAEIGKTDQASQSLVIAMRLAAKPGRSQQARVEGSMCAQVLGSLQLAAGDVDAALGTVERGLALYLDNLALHWIRARCHVAAGQTQRAFTAIGPVLAHVGTDFFDPCLAYEKSLFAEDTYALMGAAHFRAGDFDEAAGCYARALEYAPGSIEYRTKKALCENRRAASQA